MPKGDELKFQGGTTSNTEGKQGNEGRKNRDHAHDGMAPTQKSLFFFADLDFAQAQAAANADMAVNTTPAIDPCSDR